MQLPCALHIMCVNSIISGISWVVEDDVRWEQAYVMVRTKHLFVFSSSI